MLKALVIKELRESAGIVVLAGLAVLFVFAGLAGTPLVPFEVIQSGNYPFLSDSFTTYLAVIVGGLAIALGLRQTAWELGAGTYLFLLHRPVTRRFVFGTKLTVGLSLVLAVGSLFIVIYAVWAGAPGNKPMPFYWSMTESAWKMLLGLSLVYLGAFVSGVRPGQWFGSRLVPLTAGCLTAFAVTWCWWWWLALFAFGLFAATGLASLDFYINRRDY